MVTALHNLSADAVQTPWEQAVSLMDWRQGEHVVLIGPTGSGKTELLLRLIEQRRYVVFLGTKRQDSTQRRLQRTMGFKHVRDAKQIEPEIHRRILLRPDFPRLGAKELKAFHRTIFREGLMRIYRQGGWTLAMDETRYIADHLGLTEELMLIMLQGRSEDITVVAGTQRPVWIPREVVDQATHIFIWRPRDTADLVRLREIAGDRNDALMEAMRTMSKHDVFYLHADERDRMTITNTRW